MHYMPAAKVKPRSMPLARQAGWLPARTVDVVEMEIRLARLSRDKHLADGQLRLTAEDGFELEQLTREHAALRAQAIRSLRAHPSRNA
jgi:hypothetical protein